MKDLSKEERLEQQISKLERRIYELADACDKKKWLRTKRTFFVLSGVMYLIELYCVFNNEIGDINIESILGLLVAPLFAAGFVMFISYGILFYIIDGAMKDEKAIAKLIGELNAIKFNRE